MIYLFCTLTSIGSGVLDIFTQRHKPQFFISIQRKAINLGLWLAKSDKLKASEKAKREIVDTPTAVNWEIKQKTQINCTSIFDARYYWMVSMRKFNFSRFFVPLIRHNRGRLSEWRMRIHRKYESRSFGNRAWEWLRSAWNGDTAWLGMKAARCVNKMHHREACRRACSNRAALQHSSPYLALTSASRALRDENGFCEHIFQYS